MASVQDDAVLPEGGLSSSSQDDEEEDDVIDDDEEEDDVDDDDDVINSASPSTSSAGATDSLPVAIATPTVTVALPARLPPTLAVTTTLATPTTVIANEAVLSDPKRLAVLSSQPEEKKPAALDDSRRLFQRLWTDEDEIELLQGFLDYTTQREGNKGSSHHGQNDTALFYDQIKSKLQLDFNKNQLVEKLRRLKKKYRNVLNKIASGKEVSFKSPHDQATFEISRKIWRNIGRIGGPDDNALDDEDPSPNPNFNSYEIKHEETPGFLGDKKSTPRSRKRSRTTTHKPDEKLPPRGGSIEPSPVIKDNNNGVNNSNHGGGGGGINCSNCNAHGVIEETVRSCLSPMFKELLNSAMGGGASRGFGGLAFNPIPLSFGGPLMNFNFGGGGEAAEERWRKQQILELEVYSKRLELVQSQIKVALDELRFNGG